MTADELPCSVLLENCQLPAFSLPGSRTLNSDLPENQDRLQPENKGRGPTFQDPGSSCAPQELAHVVWGRTKQHSLLPVCTLDGFSLFIIKVP